MKAKVLLSFTICQPAASQPWTYCLDHHSLQRWMHYTQLVPVGSEWEDRLYQHIPPTIPNINKSDEEEDNKIAQDLPCNVFPWFIRRPSSHSAVLYLCCTIIMRRKKTSESEMNTKYFTIIHGFSLSIHLFSLTSCVFTRPATAAALSPD